MRIKAAAALLGVTPLTLRNWDKKGHLTAYRHPVNNYRLYRTADVQTLLSRFQKPRTNSDIDAPAPEEPKPELESAPLPRELERPAPIVQKLEVMFEDEV